MEDKKIICDNETIAKIAWYYYIDNLTQQQISDRLGIPRLRVIRLLERARETGIVQFKIRDENEHVSMENRITRFFGLKDTHIVTAGSSENGSEVIAQAAARYISSRLPEDGFINMGYGDTSSRILNYLADNTGQRISVVSLTGGVNHYLPNTKSNIFTAKLYLTPAPFVMSSPEMVKAIYNEPDVREIASMVPLSAMSVVGIGGTDENATVIRRGIFSQQDLLRLSMQGAVGDVLCHFYDINGKPILSEIEDRLISTPLETLAKQENVIGVAAGANKVNAIIGALNGKFLNILITDDETAASIIEKCGIAA